MPAFLTPRIRDGYRESRVQIWLHYQRGTLKTNVVVQIPTFIISTNSDCTSYAVVSEEPFVKEEQNEGDKDGGDVDDGD